MCNVDFRKLEKVACPRCPVCALPPQGFIGRDTLTCIETDPYTGKIPEC